MDYLIGLPLLVINCDPLLLEKIEGTKLEKSFYLSNEKPKLLKMPTIDFVV